MKGLKPGQQFAGKYKILEQIGRGSAGTVYKAVQESVGREVAVKVLSTAMSQQPEMIERFRREAFNISQLKHPNTVTLFDYGESEQGAYYIAMEMLDGRTLRQAVREGPLPAARAVRVMAQVLRSLREAHSQGIVHRDLKPDNIFLAEIPGERDLVKVLDFGIAKALGREEAQLTEHGMVFGTPSYMAPEQATGTGLSPATDVYAAALIFYEMLSGRMAFRAESMYALLNMQVYDPVPELRGPLANGPYNRLIAHASAKDAEARFSDAGDFLTAFHEAFAWLDPTPGSGRERRSRGVPPPRPSEIPPPLAEPPMAAPTQMLDRAQVDADAVEDDLTNVAVTQYLNHGAPQPPEAGTLMDVGQTWMERRPELELDVESPFAPWAPPLLLDDPPLIGGAALESLLEHAASDGAWMALFAGPSGTGKTRLIDAAFEALHPDEKAVVGRGREGTHRLPFGGVLEALRNLRSEPVDPDGVICQITDRWLMENLGHGQPLYPFFLKLFDERADLPDASQLAPMLVEMLFACVEQLALSLTRALGPLILALDDIDRTDEWTVHLLNYLVQSPQLRSAPVGLLLTIDPGPLQGRPDVAEAITGIGWVLGDAFLNAALPTLEREDYDVFLRGIGPLSASTRDMLWQLSMGNPGESLEILQEAEMSGALSCEAGIWRAESLAPTDAQRDDLHGRLEARAPGAEPGRGLFPLVLQWVAVLGPEVPRHTLTSALRDDPRARDKRAVSNVIDGMIASGFLRAPGEDRATLIIPRGVAVSVLREDLETDPQAEALHKIALRLKRTLTWRDPVDRDLQLAAHQLALGSRSEALEHMLDAADAARQRGDLAVAEDNYTRIEAILAELGTPEDNAPRLTALASLAEVRLRLGRPHDAIEVLTEIEALTTEKVRHNAVHRRARRLLGLAMHRRFDLRGAFERLREVLETDLATSATPFTAELLWTLGTVAHSLGQLPMRDGCIERLSDIAGRGAQELQITGLLGQGILHRLTNDTDAARRCLQGAAALHDTTARSWRLALALLHLGHVELESANPAPARDALTRALGVADTIGAQLMGAEARCGLARAALDDGQLPDAEVLLRAAWSIARHLRLPWNMVDALLTTAELRARQGQTERGELHFDTAVEMIRAMGQHERIEAHWRYVAGRVQDAMDA